MGTKIKSARGYVTADAVLGIGIFLILSTLIVTLLFNIYSVKVSSHRMAMATNYAVEILENAKILDYHDSKLNAGVYEANDILGVNMGKNYIAKLSIMDYNKLQGNEKKENLIKILQLNIEYDDGELKKNIKFDTLKYNK